MAAKRAHDQAFPEDKDTGQQDEVLPPGESHWDSLPPLIRDTILFWKAVGEHRQRMPTLRKEIETVSLFLLQTEIPSPPHSLEPMALVDAKRTPRLFRRLLPETWSPVTHPCCFVLAQAPPIGTGCPPWSKTCFYFGRGWPNTGST